MNIVTTEVKRIIESLGLIYLRTVNINDLNEQVGNVKITPGAGIYANTPVIDNETYLNAPGVLMQYQIEVYFLQLNYETDDPGEQIDTILDQCHIWANQFFDEFKKSSIIQGGITDYTLDAVETLKMSKEVLTGFKLEMTLPIPRTSFYCPLPSGQREVQDVFDKMEGLTDKEKDAIETFVLTLFNAGIWGSSELNYSDSLLIGFWHLGLFSENNALLSWINDFSAVTSGNTHSPGEGYLFTGNAGIVTALVPAFDGMNLNNMSIGGSGIIISTEENKPLVIASFEAQIRDNKASNDRTQYSAFSDIEPANNGSGGINSGEVWQSQTDNIIGQICYRDGLILVQDARLPIAKLPTDPFTFGGPELDPADLVKCGWVGFELDPVIMSNAIVQLNTDLEPTPPPSIQGTFTSGVQSGTQLRCLDISNNIDFNIGDQILIKSDDLVYNEMAEILSFNGTNWFNCTAFYTSDCGPGTYSKPI